MDLDGPQSILLGWDFGAVHTPGPENMFICSLLKITLPSTQKKKYTAIEIDDSILEIGGHKYKPLFRG